jgi:polygalacturonase
LFSFCLSSETRPRRKKPLCLRYGASTDSTKLSTKAIQQAIDKASASGGGTVVIAKGVFLSGALFFKPNTHLQVQAGAKPRGSDNIANYPLISSRMEGQKLYYYVCRPPKPTPRRSLRKRCNPMSRFA